MLGSVKSKRIWDWSVCGKHPVASDYFRVGATDALLRAFAEWVEKGYQMLDLKPGRPCDLHSWRFWTRGPKKGNLAFGVGRDSSDSLGRPYPLLVMGSGPLDGWIEHWHLLPFAFEKTWVFMESLTTRRFMNFKQMEEEVRIIPPPGTQWSELKSRGPSHGEFEISSARESYRDFEVIRKKVVGLAHKADFIVPLHSEFENDPQSMAGFWHYLLKRQIKKVPHTVFMGGIPAKTCLAVFNRPLAPSDFIRLWSVGTDSFF